MSEAKWLAATSVIGLDLWRSAKQQHRKWRLFGVACCRRAMTVANEPRLEPLAVAAEQFADGEITWEDVKRVRKLLPLVNKEVGDPFGPKEPLKDTLHGLDKVTSNKPVESLGADQPCYFAFAALARKSTSTEAWTQAAKAEEKVQLELARCIFGNPFRPVEFDTLWRSETVLALATGIYTERAFDRLPILADALEEAGCDHSDILTHCRGPGPHSRGCWVVDLVLKKA
jgi:hypothetical protein